MCVGVWIIYAPCAEGHEQESVNRDVRRVPCVRGKGKKGVRSSGGGVRRKVRDRECGRERGGEGMEWNEESGGKVRRKERWWRREGRGKGVWERE